MRALFNRKSNCSLGCLTLLLIMLLTVAGTEMSWAHQDEGPVLQSSPANVEIKLLEQKLKQEPDSIPLQNRFAKAYIMKGRDEGGHASFSQAEKILDSVLKKAPDNKDALYLRAWVAMFEHQFTEAAAWAIKGIKYHPNASFFYGILSDSNLERGNITNAVALAQKMLDLKPDQGSYSRAAHLRSIHGDYEGAIELWQMATRAGSTDKVDTAWCQVELGNEYRKQGNAEKADQAYRTALALVPGYPKAEAALAKSKVTSKGQAALKM